MDFILREWREADVNALAKYADNPRIARFLTDQFPSPYTPEDAKSYLQAIAGQQLTQVFAIEIDGEAAGSIGVFPKSDIHRKSAEMGYWLAEEYWGRGIMTEAIGRMVDYAFRTFDITRIFAGPFGTNFGSQRVLEKAGFTLEARFKEVLFKDGEYEDELIYAIRK